MLMSVNFEIPAQIALHSVQLLLWNINFGFLWKKKNKNKNRNKNKNKNKKR